MTDQTTDAVSGDGIRQIRLQRIAHVYYTHKDVDQATQFLEDFGFQRVSEVGGTTYFRGTSTEPFVYCVRRGDQNRFDGAAFVVESEEDLELASRTLPGASEILTLNDAPGGGHCVTFRDPVDGFPFHLVHGQTSRRNPEVFPQLKFNYVSDVFLSASFSS